MLSSIFSGLNGLALALIAVIGAWLAGRQMVIAQQRLQHDTFYRLFDMRFDVYKATREFWRKGFEMRAFLRRTFNFSGFALLKQSFYSMMNWRSISPRFASELLYGSTAFPSLRNSPTGKRMRD